MCNVEGGQAWESPCDYSDRLADHQYQSTFTPLFLASLTTEKFNSNPQLRLTKASHKLLGRGKRCDRMQGGSGIGTGHLRQGCGLPCLGLLETMESMSIVAFRRFPTAGSSLCQRAGFKGATSSMIPGVLRHRVPLSTWS
jgi:hypothetical protein